MAKKIEVAPNQMVLSCLPELVPEDIYPGIGPEKRIALTTLLPVVAQTVRFGQEPTVDDYFHAEPGYIERGLFVAPTDPRFRKSPPIITVGVPSGRANLGRTTRDFGVAFPPTEFHIVARNPGDFARHIANKTARARLGDPDRDAAQDAAKRSSGHALIAKMTTQRDLGTRYNEELRVYNQVHTDLYYPSRTRYKFKNIEKRRALVDEKIHETIEVASAALDLRSAAINGLHKAVKRNLYNGNYSSAQFRFHWIRTAKLLIKHTTAKREKLKISFKMSDKELEEYRPFLESSNTLLST